MRQVQRKPLASRSVSCRRFRPSLEVLEDRLAPAADPLFGQFQSVGGLLSLHGDNANDLFAASLSSDGFVQLNVAGQLFSSNPGTADYDSALAGATGQTLKAIQLTGNAGLDELVLGNLSLPGGFSVASDGILDVQGQISAAGPIQLSGQSVLLAGQVRADGTTGGSITVTAGSVLQSGLLEADGSQGAGGTILVDFTNQYLATVSSVTSASGTGTGAGGQIVIDGSTTGNLFSSGQYQANAENGGPGGGIDLFGAQVHLVGASIDASGWSGGGWVRVGGDSPADIAAHGGSAAGVSFADTTTVDATTTLSANAVGAGNGGRIVVWSQTSSTFYGSLDAQGAGNLGQGGLLEVSSAGLLTYGGQASATAASGSQGRLLLDPANLTISSNAGLPQFNLLNAQSNSADSFGTTMVTLSNGNVVITDPTSSLAFPNGGAVFLYDGQTGALLATLTGATSGDQVGSGGVTALNNGNFVVSSPNWQNSGVPVGAATWVSGAASTVATVSSANSIIGTTSGDEVGNGGVTALANGNFVVSSTAWQSGGANVGAVTWGNGATGTFEVVSAANSLVGSTSNDDVGSGGVTALTNGNYVVCSPSWQNVANSSSGAATWGDGFGGATVGAVSAANSLVAGLNGGGVAFSVTALSNGNYVVSSAGWDNGSALAIGAVTWVNGTNGHTYDSSNTIDTANSLYGTANFDFVGTGGVTALSNGSYVVSSSDWHNSGADVGAVTWGASNGGTVGPVTASNSLVGSTDGDDVGSGGVTALTSGAYVVSSPDWQNHGADVGAVTWGASGGSTVGAVSTGNSLVGSTDGDQVGSGGVTALTNGAYVVSSPAWQNHGADVGAVTWGASAGSTVGAVSTSNSLVGSTNGDQVGSGGVTPLSNGNYVVSSPEWQNSGADVGAVTWGASGGSTVGAITTNNSLVGSTNGDQVGSGGVTALSNGNFVVSSPDWQSHGAQLGAVTWSSGATGKTSDAANTIDTANSLVGASSQNLLQQVVGLPGGNAFLVSFSGGGGSVIEVQAAASAETYATAATQNVSLAPSFLTATLDTGTAVVLEASNDITVSSPIVVVPGGAAGNLTLQAGRSIILNASITTGNGNLTLIANDSAADGVVNGQRNAGAAVITMNAGTSINAGSGNISITLGTGAGNTNFASGDITLGNITGNNITLDNNGGGNVNTSAVTATGNLIVQSTDGISQASPEVINVSGTTTLTAAGPILLGNSLNLFGNTVTFTDPGGAVALGASGNLALASTSTAATLTALAKGSLSASNALAVSGAVSFTGGSISLTNAGNDFAGVVTLDSTGAVSLTDSAALTLGNAYLSGSTSLAAPSITFGATLNVGSQSLSLTSTGAADLDGATTLAGGTVSDTAGLAVGTGASLSGFGILQAGVGSAGVMIDGSAALNPGTSGLTVDGDLTLSSASTLTVDIQGTSQFSQLTVNGAINLGGASLQVTVVSPYQPAALAQFQIITNGPGNAINGAFAQGATLAVGGNTLGINYADATNNVGLTVQGAPASVTALPQFSSSVGFTVSWTGTEYPQGTAYNVYVSDSGAPFSLWQSDTTNTSAAYTGQVGHNYSFFVVYTDDAGSATPVAQASTTIPIVPTITWSNPSAIAYGTALSGTQLNASASVNLTSVPGTFTYTPAIGTILGAGANQTLSVTFTPNNTNVYGPAQASVQISVQAATPTFSGLSSPTIAYGTATTVISGHLNANAGGQAVPAGEIVQVTIDGVSQNALLNGSDNFSTSFATAALGVTPTGYTIGFSYNSDGNFTSANTSTTLTVTQATPTITWNNPAAIIYGTALGATQLKAAASTSGSFTYTLADDSTSASGAVLHAGASQTLNVAFTPGDAVDFTSASAAVTITVQQKTLTAAIAGAPSKVYDGTTTATLTPANFQLVGLVGNDSFTVAQTAGAFNSKNTNATTVNAALSAGQFSAGAGTLASDYVLPTSASGPGSISAKTVTAAIVSAPTKVYNGTATATLTPGDFQLTGLVGSESFTVTQTLGAYNSKDTTATTISSALSAANFTAAAGTLASDYLLPTTASGAGTITPASQTITFNVTSPIVYSAPIALSASGGNSGNAVTFSVISGPGTIVGTNTLAFTGAGTIVIDADQAANLDYSAAPTVQRTMVVGAAFTVSPSENENATPTAVTVSSVLGNNYGATDGVPGIAVFQTGGNGVWQYSTAGKTWIAISGASQAQALLLPGADQLRFVPTVNSSGQANLYFVGWNGSQGVAGGTANISSGGGATAFSVKAGALAMTVNPVPRWVGSGATFTSLLPNPTPPAGDTIAAVFGNYFQDNNQAVQVGVAIEGVTGSASGAWQYQTAGSSTWVPFQTVAANALLLLSGSDVVRFVPNTNFVGTASLTALPWDGTSGENGSVVPPASLASSSIGTTALTATISIGKAPTLTTTAITLSPVQQYATGAAITVSSLLTKAGYADINAKAAQGIAVVGAAGGGAYQYLLTGGSWQPLPSVSAASALLLPSTASLRLVAGSQIGSTATLNFQGWDQTQGLAGQTFDIVSPGGASAFGTAVATVSISVTASTNHAPSLSNPAFPEPAMVVNTTGAAITVSSLLTKAGYADQGGALTGIAVTGVSGGSGQYMLAGGAWQTLPNVSSASALLLPSTASLRMIAGSQPGAATFMFLGWDQTQGAAGQLFNAANPGGITAFSSTSATVSIPIGQAPSWNALAGAALASLPPGAYSISNNTAPAGNTIAAVFGSFYADSHPNPTVGVAVSAVSGAGLWQYSLTGGASWVNLKPSKTSAVLLAATDLIRFVPSGTAAVTGTLTAYAWDGSVRTPGAAVNLTQLGTGGVSAFSATTVTATSAFNKTPTLANTSVALSPASESAATPEMTATSLLAKAGYVDPDGTKLPAGIAVTGDTGPGAWQWLNGAVWTALPSVSASSAFLLSGSTELRFLPIDNLASNSSSPAMLTFLGWDETAGLADQSFAPASQPSAFTAAQATASMSINFAKQAPSWTSGVPAAFTPVLSFAAGNPMPAGSTVAAVFGGAFHDANGATVGIAVSAVSGTALGAWQFSTNNGSTWQAFPATLSAGAALLLQGSDLIRFVPSQPFSGTVSLTAYAWDGTGTFTTDIANVTKTGTGGANPFSATTLTATCLVNSAPTL